MSRVVIFLIKAYRYLLSPLFGPSCRYHPTCSSYAITAVNRFGITKGLWLSVRRIGRCHPWHEGGYDPVPAKQCETKNSLVD